MKNMSKPITKRKILVIEGPAGSGKSYLVERIRREIGIPVISSGLSLRDPELSSAILQSGANDYYKLISALFQLDFVVVIERFLLSQAVYGSLRRGRVYGLNNETGYDHNILKLKRLAPVMTDEREYLSRAIDFAIHDYGWRGRIDTRSEIVTCSWLIILPDPEVIQSRRKLRDKKYPWHSHAEVMLYLEVYKQMFENRSDIRCVTNNTDEDFKNILEGIMKWAGNSRTLQQTLEPQADVLTIDLLTSLNPEESWSHVSY